MPRDGKHTTYLSVGMITLGFALMFLAWNGAASLDRIQGQLPYLLSGTGPGLGLVMTGLTLAIVQEIRRTGARVIASLEDAAATPAQGQAATPALVPEHGHVLATGSTFHEAGCEVVAGRTDAVAMGPEAAVARGLRACRVCEPGTAVA